MASAYQPLYERAVFLFQAIWQILTLLGLWQIGFLIFSLNEDHIRVKVLSNERVLQVATTPSPNATQPDKSTAL